MPFPILETLRQALLTLRFRPRQWLVAFSPMLALEFAALVWSEYALPLRLLAMPLAIPCACAWHRNLIAGESVRIRWGRAEWFFLKTSLMVGLLSLLPMLLTAVAMTQLGEEITWKHHILFLATFSVITWITLPTVLTLPANALGHEPTSKDFAKLVAPHRLRLSALLMALPLTDAMISLLLSPLDSWAHYIDTMLRLIFWPLGVSVLSLAYIWVSHSSAKDHAE